MYPLSFFSRLFGIEKDNHALCVAQYNALSLFMPLFFLIISLALAAISFVTLGNAPAFLAVVVPILLLIVDLVVFNSFSISRSRNAVSFRVQIVNRLHIIVWGLMVIGLLRVAWIIVLFDYGDREIKELIIALIAISTFGAVLSLIRLRVAASLFTAIMMVPIIIVLLLSLDLVFVIFAFILALISAVIFYEVNRYGQDFVRMVMQKQEVEIKKTEAEFLSKLNISMANQDSLTGLANRRAFMSHLQAQVENINNGNIDGLAAGILDLDGFKQINDIYGHMAGDRLLQAVGKRLTGMLFGQVYLARMGGDEFGIIVSGERSDEQLIDLGQRICKGMQVPFSLNGAMLNLGGSLGFARWVNKSDKAEKLFEKADYALYSAKDNLRGGVMIFNEQHAASIQRESSVDRRLQDANFDDEMSMVFQPILASLNANIIGFEALARWESPILGSVPPDIFIGAAERAGLINRLSAVLLEKALHEAKTWPEHLFLSFNLSMQDISSPEAMIKLVSIVNASGFDPKRITFEVTETSIMSDFERAMESLNFLKSLGAKIALDDFGTGYSSLAYIRDMPLDRLKLDRAFVAGIEDNESSGAIVQAMINMCWNLKIDCIVEGVESRSQFKALSAMGCEIFQGYYFSRPLESIDALAYALTEQAIHDVSLDKATN